MINSPFGDGTRSWVRIVNGMAENGGRDPQRRHWREPWETSGEDKTETETKIDVILYDDSERKWIDVEPGSATWWHSTSRRTRSSKISRCSISIPFEFCGILALVDSNMVKLFAKRRRSKEEIPVLRGPQFTCICEQHTSHVTFSRTCVRTF